MQVLWKLLSQIHLLFSFIQYLSRIRIVLCRIALSHSDRDHRTLFARKNERRLCTAWHYLGDNGRLISRSIVTPPAAWRHVPTTDIIHVA